MARLDRLTRRDFVKGAAALSSTLILPAWTVAPSERTTLGFIGVGGMGTAHLNGFLGRSDVQILGVCDVDEGIRNAARDKVGNDCAAYLDYRELLCRSDMDGVVIATPDHWHTRISMDACWAGMDVYCEKPLTLTVEEGTALVKTVRRTGRVFQTGSQQRSESAFYRACTLVRNGAIGEVKKVYVGLPAGGESNWAPDGESPPGLDWDRWLGPAPRVPYNPLRHPYNFRWFFDYSGGKMTDWGAHHLDIAQWGLGMDGSGPVTIEGTGTFPSKGIYETANQFEVIYTYATGQQVICRSSGRGVKFEGTDGWVHVDRGFLETEPAALKTAPLPKGVTLNESPGHYDNWLECMKTRQRPICDVEIGAGSVTVCHLGNIALRTGRKLHWDPQVKKFKNDPRADRLLSKPYRAPWTLLVMLLLCLPLLSRCASVEQGLYSEDLAVREATMAEISAQGLEAVRPLVRVAAENDPTASAGARLALQSMALRQFSPALALALLEEVSGPWPVPTRCWLLRLVSLTGGDECLPRLEKLMREDQDVKEMAEWALRRIRGDRGIGLQSGTLAKRSANCAALWDLTRTDPEAAKPKLLAALQGGHRDQAGLALDLLSRMEGAEITEALGNAVVEVKGSILLHLIRVLGRRQDSGRARADAALIAALQQAVGAEKATLLQGLGDREDPALADTFLQATEDEDEQVVMAALGALAPLRLEAALPRLETLAEKGREAEKAAALRAYLEFGEHLSGSDKEKARRIFERALSLASGNEEKIEAIACLGMLNERAVLPALRPYLGPSGEEDLRAAAARAYAPIAVEEGNPEVLKLLVSLGRDAGAVQAAAGKLAELGVQVKVPVRLGYLTRYWLLGPLPDREIWLKTDLLAPAQFIDLNRPIEAEGRTYVWQEHRLDHLDGMLDLLRAVADAENVGAYVYTQVISPRDLDVVFRFGSDDDLFCWLNGEEVHRFEGGRGWGADQDLVNVSLKPGLNTILMKVLNGGGGWAVSLCITDADGTPLVFPYEEIIGP